MSVLCLFTGVGNYFKTVERYRLKRAFVQSGYKTQIVSLPGRVMGEGGV